MLIKLEKYADKREFFFILMELKLLAKFLLMLINKKLI